MANNGIKIDSCNCCIFQTAHAAPPNAHGDWRCLNLQNMEPTTQRDYIYLFSHDYLGLI